MRCPNCNNRVVQKSGSTTRVRIKGALRFDEDGRATAQCYWCKADLTLPLNLDEGTPVASEKFVVSKVAD